MEHKLVSFVITSYNNYKYIYEAVESVLTQDYPRIQLIFSNDGSPDFDADALQSYVDQSGYGPKRGILPAKGRGGFPHVHGGG